MSSRSLDDAKRLVLAWPGRNLPILTPMAFWWDGQHVWFSTSGGSLKASALRRDASCAMYVPPVPGAEDGLMLRGTARVFHSGDPLGLAIHAGLLAAAQGALMVKHASSMMGYVVDAPRVPIRFQPQQRVLVRVRVDDQVEVTQPAIGLGIAPALPTEVPPEVRRTLAGQRRIVLGTQIDGGIGLMPAVWGAGFSLTLPEGMGVAEGTAVTAVIDHAPGFRPTEVMGLSLSGSVAAGGPALKIVPSKVRWWSGFQLHSAELSGRPTDTIVIPD
ncbi:MAG TPA: pyridoxamine 5'-phosphate oxidase family protein [Euzebya sp.]|nr:pyridoxamine 5'-phosphate oxidase family protein [Euzebya sp.]